MKSWKIPGDSQLRLIMEWCLNNEGVNRLLVANRLDYQARKTQNKREFLDPEAVAQAEDLFQGRILRKSWANNWPGTLSKEVEGLIFIIDFDTSVLGKMEELQPQLFGWLGSAQVPLPEDLCLYKVGNLWPTLVSVTHERDAWLISAEQPSLTGIENSSFTPEDLYIPPNSPDFIN